jgi:hypothetical protein
MVRIKSYTFTPSRAVIVFIITFLITLLNALPSSTLPTPDQIYTALRAALLVALTTAWTKEPATQESEKYANPN